MSDFLRRLLSPEHAARIRSGLDVQEAKRKAQQLRFQRPLMIPGNPSSVLARALSERSSK